VQKKWTDGMGVRSPDLELELDFIYKNSATSGSKTVRSLTSKYASFPFSDSRPEISAA
jgi:hypothetical protein